MIDAILQEIQTELRQFSQEPKGRLLKSQCLREYSKRYGISIGTLYRKLNNKGRSRITEFKEDKKELITKLFELQVRLSDPEAGRWLPNEQLLKIAREQKIIQDESLTGNRYAYYVRQMGLRRPRGFTRFQAGYSNEMHQMDASGSEYFEVIHATEEGDWVIQAKRRNRRGKNRAEQPQTLWAAGLVDDFSGIMIMRYYVAPGESASWLRRFLLEVWEGIHPEVLLRGMPQKLYIDNGPFAKNETTIAFLSEKTGMGIELLTSIPYNKRAHGKMERQWRTLWQSFELSFKGNHKEILLSEFNDRFLLDFILDYQNRKHRYLAGSRGAVYLQNLRGEVRLPPQNAEQSAFRVFDRRIDGSGCFQFRGKIYLIEKGLRESFRDLRVLVYENARAEVCVENVLTGQIAKAEIWAGGHAVGDFESFHETAGERIQKAQEKGDLPEIIPYWGERAEKFGIIQAPFEGRIFLETPTGKQSDEDVHHVEEKDRSKNESDISKSISGKEKKLIVRYIPAKREEGRSPMVRSGVFGSEIEARKFMALRLGVGLLELKQEAPLLMKKIEELLKETLDRERIIIWCDELQNRLSSAIGGNS